jgi:Zn-dependent peptidase ImmA (M78 family)
MNIPDKLVDLALDKAKEMADYQKQYAINGDATRKSIDDFKWIIETYLEETVNIVEIEIPAASSSIRGWIVTYEDRYEIVVLDEKNFCWKRFVTCKELFHVVLDQELFHNMDMAKQIEEIALDSMDVKPAASFNAFSEALAEIATIEFMFPFADRVAVLENIKDGDEIPAAELAERYKIPKVWVERVLSPSMMLYFKQHFDRRALELAQSAALAKKHPA